jgi:hypothetical protein
VLTPTVRVGFGVLSFRPLFSICVLICLVGSAACGGDAAPATPTAPTPLIVNTPPVETAPQVTTSVSPVPLVLRGRGAMPNPSYDLAGDVTFTETAGRAGTITEIRVAVTSAAGNVRVFNKSVTLDLSLPGRGHVIQRIAHTIEKLDGQGPYQIEIGGSGVDGEAKAFTIPGISVPATIVAPAAPPAPDVTVLAAGDIARCGEGGSEATAKLLDRMSGTVLTLGDHVYMMGSTDNFRNCYDPTWGRHRARTYPTPGNHEYDVNGALPYFDYFAPAAGPSGLGYYGFTLGGWRLLSLNSNVDASPGSAQYEWLRSELTNTPSQCTLAYWHHPVFSSGQNGNYGHMREIWRLLQNAGVEVVLNGHDHLYERFAPQDADGRADPLGIRQFTVGTGGFALYRYRTTQANSEARDNQTWGVLKLTLNATRYSWQFVPVDGQSWTDSGFASCR